MDILTQISEFITKINISLHDPTIIKIIRLMKDKNIPLNHVLAEILLYSYFRNRGYEYILIEETINNVKCDVYLRHRNYDICIEVEFYTIPIEYLGDWTEFIVARHIKKLYQIAKAGIKAAAFAYPYGIIPLIPIELIRPSHYRSKKRIQELLAIARKYYSIEEDADELLRMQHIHAVYIFDFSMGKVYEVLLQTIESLIALYQSLITY